MSIIMRTFFLLTILLALVYSQDPAKPKWPAAASTSVLVEGWTERGEDRHFFRWYYDETLGKERLDGPERFLDEWFWSTRIIDVKSQQEWFVAYQESLTACWTGKTNITLPHPNFSRVRYIGKAEIDHRVVDRWIERDATGRDVSQIYDRADNQEIKRIDFANPGRARALSIHFHEFDAGTQDPSLWVLPAEILAICNQRP